MKTNYFLPLAIIGLLIRIVLSVTTYHQDLGAITLASHHIVGEWQWLSFYDNSGKDINKTIFNYQPLAYLIPAVFYSPFANFVSETAENYVNADWQKSFTGSFNFELLFYKFPMILADILIFFILGFALKKTAYQKRIQILWALNPIAIYVSSVIGQVDIFIALFLLLSYLSLAKNKKYLSIVFVCLSALVKPIGLILLPFIIRNNKADSKVKIILSSASSLLIGAIVYLLGILPFLGSASYKYYALFADQINKTVHAGIEISAGTVIPYFFIALTFLYFLFLDKKKNTLQSIILALLASLVFTNFHPQWLIWVMPLLLLSQKGDINLVLFYFLGWLLVLLSFDKTLHLGAFINSKLELPAKLISSDLFQKVTALGRGLLVSCLLWLFSKEDAQNNE